MARILEHGELFYFYRPKVDAESPEDVQRLYLVTKSDGRYRLILIGAKALPIVSDERSPERRRWALVTTVTEDRGEIEHHLAGGEYETKTRGRRHLPPAAPVGEGRYALAEHGDHTELVHRLARTKSKELRETFALEESAAFIIAVKNPKVKVEGFPEHDPDYPEKLAELFSGRRWIAVEDTRLLDYEDTQLLLIGARDERAARAIGIELSGSDVDLREELDIDLPDTGLLEGEFPSLEEFRGRHHRPKDVDAGSAAGGRAASTRSASMSAITRLLGGVDLPATAAELRAWARDHHDRLDDPEPALAHLDDLPEGRYATMAEITRGLSKAELETFECPDCDRSFDTRSGYEQHRRTSHPQQAPSAADVEKALAGIRFPASKSDLEERVQETTGSGDERLRKLVAALPDRRYRDAADVAIGIHEAVTGQRAQRG